MLPVTSGTWYYRVRGINESLPGNQKMTWSDNSRVTIDANYKVLTIGATVGCN